MVKKIELTLEDVMRAIQALEHEERFQVLREIVRLIAEETGQKSLVEISRLCYEAFKARLRDKYPELGEVSLDKAQARFDQLSAKVREGLPFETWQEAQAFMRGSEHYDFKRQQYIYH
ncbi:MAG: hypothetical protein ACUVV0_03310 [Anaerolineae bacterium]